jgi:hypothetical protein
MADLVAQLPALGYGLLVDLMATLSICVRCPGRRHGFGGKAKGPGSLGAD